jgi:uncharacterized protein (DUF433 family)
MEQLQRQILALSPAERLRLIAFQNTSIMLQAYPHLISDPEILNGKPIIQGTRISVEIVLEWLANGASFDDMLAMHPRLTREALQEAVRYAAQLNRNEIFVSIKH